MATYNELRLLFGESSLLFRVEVAVCIKAQAIFQEASPSAARLAWAESAFENTNAEAQKFLKYALAANKALTAAQILAAADSALQSAVDAAIDKLYP